MNPRLKAPTKSSSLILVLSLLAAAHAVSARNVGVVWAGSPSSGAVALTFDDGPSPGKTDRILDILDEYGARGTFFIVGSRLESAGPRGGALLERMVREGHEIGSHSYSHPNFARISSSRIEEEIERTGDLIEEAVGLRPVLLRPPGGGLDIDAVRVISGTGISRIVLWNVDPADWEDPGRRAIWASIEPEVRPGAIILFHDTHAGTVDALPIVLEIVAAKGLEAVTVSELLARQ